MEPVNAVQMQLVMSVMVGIVRMQQALLMAIRMQHLNVPAQKTVIVHLQLILATQLMRLECVNVALICQILVCATQDGIAKT